MIAAIVLLTICISRCDSQNTNASTDAYKYIAEYEKKTCNNEPSCYLINQVPAQWTVLPVRNCMCDRDCNKYKDCCNDSIYFETQQFKNSAFQCHPAEKVYMIATCPPDYPFQNIRWKCESSIASTQGPNQKIFIPVTNRNKSITYGNEYCAVCNNDFTYELWNLSFDCSQEYDVNATTTTSTTTSPFVNYTAELSEAKKHIVYDVTSKSLVSYYNDKKYNCWYVRKQPEDIRSNLRTCVPAISSCSGNDRLQELCQSYAGYVYDAMGQMFKNVDCAQCNQVTKYTPLCNKPPYSDDIEIKIAGSSLFSTNDKASG